ncbi:winged helix-turn-helix domain-containing protein [Ferrimonas marina]|uniref:Transcriptional regulatory protein, C terminal n=1 Tax=Ferrimonas marina TaxID=299255 RepID=A0A1M5X834_9GAMM|nr:winged helix-turn-helix domain-containing protein [Ferrimonas marina]SHH95802.1 Transcriptional regulatory protein, C terminal [Ferrimonas marina]
MIQLTEEIQLDLQGFYLHTPEQSVQLTSAEAAVLHHLYQHEGEICDKNALLDAGWPDRIVATSSLVQCICTLRKKLEVCPQLSLQTIPRKGYRLNLMMAEPEHPERLVAASSSSAFSASLASSANSSTQAAASRRSFSALKYATLALIAAVLVLLFLMRPGLPADADLLRWNHQQEHQLTIGQQKGPLSVFSSEQHDNQPWQQHFVDSDWDGYRILDFTAFGLRSDLGDSMALCPNSQQNHCLGQGLINLVFPKEQPQTLNMPSFLELAKTMELRHQFNRINLPENLPEFFAEDVQLYEEIYQADVYFPDHRRLLIRADITLSLVFADAGHGIFSATLCLTDEDCITTPIKYRIDGEFRRYQDAKAGHQVELFEVFNLETALERPERVTEGTLPFYRALKRHSVNTESLLLYRLNTDSNSALWALDQDFLFWAKRSRLPL